MYEGDKCISEFMTHVCKNCKDVFCCCKSVEAPIVLEIDIDKIKINYNLHEKDFIEKEEINGKIINKLRKDNGYCKFWDSITKRCKIHDNRPFDCYIFPFDIKNESGIYNWIIYNKCYEKVPDNTNKKVSDNLLRSLENDSRFEEMKSILDIFAERPLKSYEFKLLRPLEKYGLSNHSNKIIIK